MNARGTWGVVVLGTGRVGALVARDLARDPRIEVRAVDRDEAALGRLRSEPSIAAEVRDLSAEGEVERAVADVDLVIGAVPGALGHAIVGRALEAGRNVVDIAFSPEDPMEHDRLALAQGAVAVVDCGVAPGISNWLVGRLAAELDEIESAEILVGGLPVRRVWPYEYRAVFSPADVIEEYVRPSRIRQCGRDVVVPALSGIEPVDLPVVGTVEAFYTDGLRTLLRTIPARDLREKTLRYPGHAEKMRMLRESGFFDETPVEVDGTRLAPRRMTERLLFSRWELPEGEEEVTVLRVEVVGALDDRRVRVRWDLHDRTDRASGETSMARTTGFPCAIVARMLLDGRWNEPGVHPPEMLGRDAALTEYLLGELRDRGVSIEETRERA